MTTSSFFRWLRATVAVVAVGFTNAASADIPASAYVQDGLVVQFDGIENAGAGLAHDDAATTWINLAEGATDATLPKGLFTVTSNSIVFNKGRALAEAVACASNTTADITVTAAGGSYRAETEPSSNWGGDGSIYWHWRGGMMVIVK